MYEYKAVLRDVHDGDTVTVDVDHGFHVWTHGMHIRLFGINAPELRTPEGIVARDFLMTQLSIGATLLLRSHRDQADKYGGRWDGNLFTATFAADGSYTIEVDINALMVSSGHAVVYP